jgi:hypothetical protein
MGGDDSQKLQPWRGACSSPGRSSFRFSGVPLYLKWARVPRSESFLVPAVRRGSRSAASPPETSWLRVAGRARRHVEPIPLATLLAAIEESRRGLVWSRQSGRLLRRHQH